MLISVMLNVIMLNAENNPFIMSVNMLSIVILNVIMLSVILLSVIMLNVVMRSVMATLKQYRC